MEDVFFWVLGSLLGSLLMTVPLFILGVILGLWVRAFVNGWKMAYERS